MGIIDFVVNKSFDHRPTRSALLIDFREFHREDITSNDARDGKSITEMYIVSILVL